MSLSGAFECWLVNPVMKKFHHKLYYPSFNPCFCTQSPSPFRWACLLGNLPVCFCLSPFCFPSVRPSIFLCSFSEWTGRREGGGLRWLVLCICGSSFSHPVLPPSVALVLHSDGGTGGPVSSPNSSRWRKEHSPEVLAKQAPGLWCWVSFHTRVRPLSVSSWGSYSFSIGCSEPYDLLPLMSTWVEREDSQFLWFPVISNANSLSHYLGFSS